MLHSPVPPLSEANPFHAVRDAYGVWNTAMTEDPSGTLVQQTVRSAAMSAVVFGVIGAILPFFSAAEGAKWGALVGGGRGVYEWYRRKNAPTNGGS